MEPFCQICKCCDNHERLICRIDLLHVIIDRLTHYISLLRYILNTKNLGTKQTIWFLCLTLIKNTNKKFSGQKRKKKLLKTLQTRIYTFRICSAHLAQIDHLKHKIHLMQIAVLIHINNNASIPRIFMSTFYRPWFGSSRNTSTLSRWRMGAEWAEQKSCRENLGQYDEKHSLRIHPNSGKNWMPNAAKKVDVRNRRWYCSLITFHARCRKLLHLFCRCRVWIKLTTFGNGNVEIVVPSNGWPHKLKIYITGTFLSLSDKLKLKCGMMNRTKKAPAFYLQKNNVAFGWICVVHLYAILFERAAHAAESCTCNTIVYNEPSASVGRWQRNLFGLKR